MRSRTSWFNLALVRKNVLRGWPLWTAFTLLWIAILPMTILSNGRIYTGQTDLDLARDILEMSTEAGPFITMLYGILVAAVLFSYLYKSRSVNTFGALPVRRETLFGSAIMAGLLVFLIPMLLVTIMTFFATVATGMPLPLVCLQPLAFNGLIYLFAFGLATLCAALVGNTLSLLGLFTILNFTVMAVGYTVCTLLEKFLFGFRFNDGDFMDAFDPYSPLMKLSQYNLDVDWQDGELIGVAINTWDYVLLIALVGLICFAVSFLLFRRRHMERAGDVIAVKQLRPVFKYVFATGCAIVLGCMFCTIWNLDGFPAVLLCCLLGGFLGYFLAEILLKKSFAVWKKEWLGFGCFALATTALLCFTYFDGWGYERRVPTTDMVASVQIADIAYNTQWKEPLEDPAFITDAIALHQAILHEKFKPTWQESYSIFNVRYTLFDGSTFERTYRVPYVPAQWDGDGLYGQYCSLLTDPYFLEATLPQAFQNITSVKDFAWGEISNYKEPDGSSDTHLTQEEAYRLYTTAFLPDLRDGNIGFDLEHKNQTRNEDGTRTRISFDVFADYIDDNDQPMAAVTTKDHPIDDDRPVDSLSITVTPYATRTIAAIEAMGIPYYPTVEIE